MAALLASAGGPSSPLMSVSLSAPEVLATKDSLFAMSMAMHGFDGKGGFATVALAPAFAAASASGSASGSAPAAVSASASASLKVYVWLELAIARPRPLELVVGGTTLGTVALDATGSDSGPPRWFKYGPFALPLVAESFTLRTSGYWPHVAQIALERAPAAAALARTPAPVPAPAPAPALAPAPAPAPAAALSAREALAPRSRHFLSRVKTPSHAGVAEMVAAARLRQQSRPADGPYRHWLVPPSQPMRAELVADIEHFTDVRRLQPANPGFAPDASFYNSVNLDGLWVCASKACPAGTVERAAALLSAYVPVELRRLCLQWRAPEGRPLGPMRVVIMDNVSGQKAGDGPEFPDDWAGRNGTSNPASFTSAEDIVDAGRGGLTVHEFTHALDMVIRQQLDPFFMQELDDCFVEALRNDTYKKAYAAASRHEYIAELCALFVSTHPRSFRRGCHECGEAAAGVCDFPRHALLPPGAGGVDLEAKSHLIEHDPAGYLLLRKYLVEIDPSDAHWQEVLDLKV